MSFFTRVKAALTPHPTSAPARPPFIARAYEATSTTPRVADWEQIAYGPNAALDDAHLARARAQDAVRNNPWIAHALRLLVSHTIGCGIQLHPLIEDPAQRARVQDLWDHWTGEADADGAHHFNGWQSLLTRAALESGEVFVRLRPRRPEDGLSVPLQVQALEAALLPLHHNAPNGANTIRQGIELNPVGRRVAYWFHPEHPGDRFLHPDRATLTRVPAEAVLHHYQPLRPGQLRGAPTPISILYRARNLDHYESAELTRKKNKARFSGAIWKDNPEDNPLSNTPANPALQALQTQLASVEASAEYQANDPATVALAASLREQILVEQERKTFVDIEDGYLLQLGMNERIELFGGDTGNAGAIDFLRTHLRAMAAGMGVPFELMTGDYSGTNDRIMRVILNTFYRDLEIAQERLIHQVLQPIYNAWLDAAYFSRALILPDYEHQRRTWQRCEWRAHAWSYVNPLQEAQTAVLKIQNGLTSRRAVVAEANWDIEEIDRQQAEDHAREERLGLRYGVTATAPTNPPLEYPV
ncbi:MAG TPA: phage portal protein [Verrucomicrobiota bacterium]|nr:phage portal protein [Verrucomicrobiota bacterium]